MKDSVAAKPSIRISATITKATVPNNETEIKLAVPDAAAGRRLFRSAGFRVFKRRVLEINDVFDTPGLKLRRGALLVRVRRAGNVATLTYKGRPVAGKHKSREELELQISDAPMMSTILGRLGYQPVFRYEKYRTEYCQPGARGVATVDETPIGTFLELEGAPSWIDRTARHLGFAETDYITDSYGRLYLDWCSRQGLKPSNMVFHA